MTEEKHMPDPGSPDTGRPREGEVKKNEGTDTGPTVEIPAELLEKFTKALAGKPKGAKMRAPETKKAARKEKEDPEENPANTGDAQEQEENSPEKTFEKFKKSLGELPPEFVEGLDPSLLSLESSEEIVKDLSDKSTSIERLIEIAKQKKFPPKTYKKILESMGQDPEKIEAVISSGQLPEEPQKGEEDEEDMKEVEETNKEGGILDELGAVNKEGAKLVDSLAGKEELSDDDVETISAFREKANSLMEKVHDRLFNGDNGLLRPEKRFKRLVLKPIVTLLLVTMIAYIASLSMLTSRSAQKLK